MRHQQPLHPRAQTPMPARPARRAAAAAFALGGIPAENYWAEHHPSSLEPLVLCSHRAGTFGVATLQHQPGRLQRAAGSGGHGGQGVALTASRPLLHLTRLRLWLPHDLTVPWRQLPALLELELLGENADLLQGATQLTALSSLHLHCASGFVLPPGAWLPGVRRLVLEDFLDEVSGIVACWAACWAVGGASIGPGSTHAKLHGGACSH